MGELTPQLIDSWASLGVAGVALGGLIWLLIVLLKDHKETEKRLFDIHAENIKVLQTLGQNMEAQTEQVRLGNEQGTKIIQAFKSHEDWTQKQIELAVQRLEMKIAK